MVYGFDPGNAGFRDLRNLWTHLHAHTHALYPALWVRLVIDATAGLRKGKSCVRAFAYCAPDSSKRKQANRRATGDAYVIGVAPKILQAPQGRMEALLCHELAHAILLHEGDDTHTERDADDRAEEEFGIRIFYDSDDVQTTDPFATGTRRPRPAYLDDANGFTK